MNKFILMKANLKEFNKEKVAQINLNRFLLCTILQ